MFKKYSIPVAEGEAFLKSMFMDEEERRYANCGARRIHVRLGGRDRVDGHAYRRFFGRAAFPYAVKLGYAFQLTNFLRDIREDWDELGRVYMPKDELAKFGLDKQDIGRHAATSGSWHS